MHDGSRIERVAVVGAGAWGTALAQAAAIAGRDVTLLARDAELARQIQDTRSNASYLPDQSLHKAIFATADAVLIGAADLILLVVPAQTSRSVLESLKAEIAGKPVVLCAKGLEAETLARQSEVLAEVVPDAKALVLSGPSFAHDVAAGRPTAVSLAGSDAKLADEVAQALSGPTLRLYASSDVAGVELAGALKNVYALACGAVEGAGLGLSARSALIARSFAELSRLVAALGGQRDTLAGLAGLGDLTLSCTSAQSRNYASGIALGRGERGVDLMRADAPLAEGIKTAPVAALLARRAVVDVPLVDAVNLLLGGEMAISDIVAQLMARPLKREGQN